MRQQFFNIERQRKWSNGYKLKLFVTKRNLISLYWHLEPHPNSYIFFLARIDMEIDAIVNGKASGGLLIPAKSGYWDFDWNSVHAPDKDGEWWCLGRGDWSSRTEIDRQTLSGTQGWATDGWVEAKWEESGQTLYFGRMNLLLVILIDGLLKYIFGG